MHTVVSTFADAASAKHAAQKLVESGVAPGAVRLHRRDDPATNAAELKLDEYATGGLVSNMLGLLDRLFEAPQRPDEAESYVEVVQREAVGLSVEVPGADDADRAEALLAQAGAMQVARVGAEGT